MKKTAFSRAISQQVAAIKKLLFVLALSLSLILTSCSGGEPPPDNPDSSEQEGNPPEKDPGSEDGGENEDNAEGDENEENGDNEENGGNESGGGIVLPEDKF